MPNGSSEPIQFTRGDAERLATVETKIINMSKHVGRIVKFGYVVGVSVTGSAVGIFIKIVLFS